MKFILFISTFVIGLISYSVAHFERDAESTGLKLSKDDFKTFLLKAEMQQELVFVIASSEHCFPCEQMNQKIKKNKILVKYINKNYLSYKFDRTSSDVTYIMERYKLSQFPSVLFLDSHGNVIAKLVGERTPSEIYRFAKKIKKKMK